MSDFSQLALEMKAWAQALGFAELRVSDVDLSHAEPGLEAWLAAGFHGDMAYMQSHGMKRARPEELVEGSIRAITVRMNYLPQNSSENWAKKELDLPADQAVISIYARGRDYHKILRARLQQLAEQIQARIGSFGYRVFTDSAPVMEVALAEKSGLGWRGKHTLLLNREGGSMFFLGEILVDIPLPIDPPITDHCGQCTSCITACPTQAIIAPYKLDARRCISYLTIEHHGSIPIELRPLIGNRVYGCDDCQLVCPWNKFAQTSNIKDFDVRNGLDAAKMVDLFAWTEEEFLRKLEGSPIRRIGYERWLRNLAVGLGNAGSKYSKDQSILNALNQKRNHASALVREHVLWAITQIDSIN